ncbi:MAG TPA: hypothetical protein DF712_23610 [Balneola sp.]|nr:hypothetical protein [Balneola sp.]
MIVYSFLIISVIINIFFVWYVRELLRRFNFFSNNFSIFDKTVKDYEDHLDTVYGLETFYGDSTLAGLLQHTREFSDLIKQMRENFDIEEQNQEEE